ncbi:MAG: hypothetical protein JSW00_05735 [Thermoplasmata archaeon]|nr:MAG: hypothetical protein JSW00_05735 [Thermoplasmata archaeon]
MSELTLTLKKAIPIIVVTWILSLVTTLAVVYFTPNIFPKTWHEIERFEGYDTDDYENSFDVPSMHWRIRLGLFGDLPSDNGSFQLTVDDFALRKLPWEYIWAGYLGDNYFTGSGRHWIEVYADNVEWVIIVEAYY